MATQAFSLARVRGPLVLAALTLLGACSSRTAVPTPAPVAGSPSVAPESPRPPEVASGYRTGMT
ncbi:gamma-glutamyltransferase, partial [Ralstonia pseudosolanacearum]